MEENYLMHYDAETGEIKGFFLRSLHGDIPTPYVEISPEKHDFYINNNGAYKLNPQTMEDELIELKMELPGPTSTQGRLDAIESAISALMGV